MTTSSASFELTASSVADSSAVFATSQSHEGKKQGLKSRVARAMPGRCLLGQLSDAVRRHPPRRSMLTKDSSESGSHTLGRGTGGSPLVGEKSAMHMKGGTEKRFEENGPEAP